MDFANSLKSSENLDWKILIIDDDEEDYILARDMLKEARGRKVDVHWSSSYPAGREELLASHYHAVLVDYDLGPHSGIELIREATERGYAAPLILFTGRGSYEVDIEAMEAGATLYLSKGEANPLLLERGIRYAIELKQKEQNLRASEAALRQSESTLHRLETRWNAAIESIDVGVIIATEDEQIIYWNPAARRMHGFTTPDEGIEPLEQTPITFQLWTADGNLLELDEWPMRRIKRGEPVRNLELGIRRPDQGWEKIFSYSGTMVDTIAGERLIFLTCQDLTEQRRVEAALREGEEKLQASEHKFSTLFQKAAYAAILGSLPDSTVVDVNEAWEKLYGYTRTEVIGKTVPELNLVVDPEQRPRYLAELMEKGYVHDYELQIRIKTGEVRTMRVNFDLLEIGGKQYTLNTSYDITTFKQAETALRQSEEKYAKSFRSSPAAIAISTLVEGRFTEVNDRFTDIFGYTPEEMIGHTSIELGLYPDPAERNNILRLIEEEGRFRDYEIRLLSRGGEPRDLHFSGERIEVDGQAYLLALILDVTGRKQAEQRIVERENRLRDFVESTRNNYIALDRQWRFTYANRNYGEVMGVNPEELIGKNYWDVFPQYLGTELEQNYHKVMEEGTPLSFRQGGVYTASQYDVSVYPTREGLAIFSIDRTEEVRHQLELENERARLEAVLEALPVGVWITDAKGRIVGKNAQADQIWAGDAPLVEKVDQYPVYQAWDTTTGKQLEPEEYPMIVALHTGQSVERKELRIRRLDGSEGFVLVSATAIKDGDGRTTGAVAINVDITERKQAEQALKQAEEKFSKAFLYNPVALAITRISDGRYLEVNEAFYQLTGYSQEEIIGHTVHEIGMYAEPGKRAEMVKLIQSEGRLRNYEIEIRTKARAIRSILTSIDPIQMNGETWLLTTFIDITERKETEQALRESELLLRDFLENTQESFFLIDRDWHIRYINRNLAELLQTSAEALSGKSFWEAFPNYIGTPVEEHYRKVMNERVPVHFQMGGVYTPFWFDISVYPTQEGIGVFTIDRTQEKQAEQALELERAKLAAAIEEIPVGVCIGDAQGNVLSLNNAGLKLHDFSSEAEMFSRVENYLQEFELRFLDGRPIPVSEWPSSKALRGDFVQNFEVMLRNLQNGKERVVAYSASPVKNNNGETILIIYTLQDLTDRKEAELSLQHYAHELERSNQALQDFAFIASHDLQEPLRKIILFGNSLRRQLGDTPDEAAEDSLRRMQNAAERMQTMIQGLLELSRISTRSRNDTPIQLNILLAEVISDLEVRIQAVNGQVIVGDLPSIEADELQMRQLFQNLLSNALKFHKPAVPPIIRISGVIHKKSNPPVAEIRVEDNGIGFQQEYAERIFQPFQRLHGKTEYEGTGLGLAICQKIVERHLGTIEVNSEPGEGTRFMIRLPLQQPK